MNKPYTLAKFGTPYVTQKPGGSASVKGGILTLETPLPEDWGFPTLAYHWMPAEAVAEGSAEGWYVVEFIDRENAHIHGPMRAHP